jgi:hypothetical protein
MAYYITRANLEQTLPIHTDEAVGVARKMMLLAKMAQSSGKRMKGTARFHQ